MVDDTVRKVSKIPSQGRSYRREISNIFGPVMSGLNLPENRVKKTEGIAEYRPTMHLKAFVLQLKRSYLAFEKLLNHDVLADSTF